MCKVVHFVVHPAFACFVGTLPKNAASHRDFQGMAPASESVDVTLSDAGAMP